MRKVNQSGAGRSRSLSRQKPASGGEKSFRKSFGRSAGERSKSGLPASQRAVRFTGEGTDTGKPRGFDKGQGSALRNVGGEQGARRRRTLGEVREQTYSRSVDFKNKQAGPGGKGKKLVLRKEKRPSRSQLLKELGHATERKTPSGSLGKTDLIRLNRFIANAGICSRREADTFITAGVVKVNGQTVTELGTKISPEDEVRFDNRLITPERKVYLLLNKPKDVVTTTDDPHAEHTVMELVKGACEERIYPVGRLDRNTTGVLLLTNDGELSKKLTHPSHKVEKVYQITLDKTVSVNDIQKIADGIELEDGFISADAVTYVEDHDKNTVGVEIHSGRHRIVRRIFEYLGYRVRALDRVSFAGLTKKNIPRGKWRFLTPQEVSFLKMK